MHEDAVTQFTARFVHRFDTFAVQQHDGGYRRIKRLLRPRDIQKHLEGNSTMALYPATPDGTVRWGCIDDDCEGGEQHLRYIAQDVRGLGLETVLELSRRGGHLWLLTKDATPSLPVRQALMALLQRADHSAEVFPEQDRPSRYGNPVRMPLGVHRLTGQRYPLLDPDTWHPLVGATAEILGGLPWVTRRELERVAALYKLVHTFEQGHQTYRPYQGSSAIGEIKGRLDLVGIAGEYTTLSRSGGLLHGLCPLHNDSRPSFHIFPDGRWWCFGAACNRGGDVLDLICGIEGWTISEAIRRLR